MCDVPQTLVNALRDPNYRPYCGDGQRCRMPRARKTGYLTFECPECGFVMDLYPSLERLLLSVGYGPNGYSRTEHLTSVT